jgi:hypothetical protein
VIIESKDIEFNTGIKQFMRKKQDEGFPILFFDSIDSNNIYKWLLDQKSINFLYEPAVIFQILNGKIK